MTKDGHRVAGFFYNPNIHPYSEYLKRRDALEKYAKEIGINVTYGDYELERYFQHMAYDEGAPSPKSPHDDGCPACWWMRLEKAGAFAKANGFEAFTTTLLGSPYQDIDVIRPIGEDVAKRLGLKFFVSDFRKGFRAARDKAKAKGIYCQNYCGCLFSEKERLDNKKERGQNPSQDGPDLIMTVKGGKKKIRCKLQAP
jgi:epoxyqueuosine reductase